MLISGARIVKKSQWRPAVKNRCVFIARLKALSDRFGDRMVADGSMWLVR